jgi:flagellar hook protein FlgE
MSLSSALSSAVSALNAQSTALSIISNNISNTSTYGYKASTASFQSYLTSTDGSASSGGVLVGTRSANTVQGDLTTSSTSTNMAISGSGYFAVKSTTSDSSAIQYTRDGEFAADSSGVLTENGYELMGWRTDSDGNVTGGTSAANLTAVDVSVAGSYAKATSTASIVANLPANAATGDSYTSSMTLYDSLGTAATSTVTWTKTGTNTWSASFADPTSTSDSSTSIGTVSSSAISITFNSNGTLESTSPSPATLSISGWTDGAADSSITLNLGTSGSSDGLTQNTSSSSSLSVSPTITQNGVAYGTYQSVSVATDGTVSATYSNGSSIPIYKVPVVSFANADGLSAGSSGIYTATTTSGSATYNVAGSNGAGKIEGGELESSTTSTSTELSSMITAQQAYSAASQVMSTANSMFTTLLNDLK